MGGKNYNWFRNGVEVNLIIGKDCREEMLGSYIVFFVYFLVLLVLI